MTGSTEKTPLLSPDGEEVDTSGGPSHARYLNKGREDRPVKEFPAGDNGQPKRMANPDYTEEEKNAVREGATNFDQYYSGLQNNAVSQRHQMLQRAETGRYMMPKFPLWLVSADFTYERVRSRWATMFMVSAMFLLLFIFIDVIMVEFPKIKGFFGPLVKFFAMFFITVVSSVALLAMLIWNNPLMPLAIIGHLGGVVSLLGGTAGVIVFLIQYHDDFAGSHSVEAGYFYYGVLGILAIGAFVCFVLSFFSKKTFFENKEAKYAASVTDKLVGWPQRLRQLERKEEEDRRKKGIAPTPEDEKAKLLFQGYVCHCGKTFYDVQPAYHHLRHYHQYRDDIFIQNSLAACLGSDLSQVHHNDKVAQFLSPHKKDHEPVHRNLATIDDLNATALKKALKKRRQQASPKDVVLIPVVVMTGSVVSFTLLTFFFIKIVRRLPEWHDALLGLRDQVQDMMNIVNTYDAGLIENFPDIPEFIDSFDGAFVACGAVAVVVAYIVAVVLTTIFPIIFFERTLLRIRHGTCHDPTAHNGQPYLPKTHKLAKATYFIAVQFSTALIGFFVLALGIFACLIIPFWDVTRELIISLMDLIIAIVLVKIVQKVIYEKIILNLWVSDGHRVRYPTVWALLSIVSMFYTLFTGVITAIVRLVMLVGIGVMALFRLDTTIYPGALAAMDGGFVAFMSVASMANRYQNPVANVAVQVLMDSMRTKQKQRMGKGQKHKGVHYIPDDNERFEEGLHTRARNRWHLAYTLIHNPGVMGHRMSHAAMMRRELEDKAMLINAGVHLTDAAFDKARKHNHKKTVDKVMKEQVEEGIADASV